MSQRVKKCQNGPVPKPGNLSELEHFNHGDVGIGKCLRRILESAGIENPRIGNCQNSKVLGLKRKAIQAADNYCLNFEGSGNELSADAFFSRFLFISLHFCFTEFRPNIALSQ